MAAAATGEGERTTGVRAWASPGVMVLRRVGKYEVGRTIGEGTFAKVKFAQNTETGESVAMKVLDRSTIIKHKMADQVAPSPLSPSFRAHAFLPRGVISHQMSFIRCFWEDCFQPPYEKFFLFSLSVDRPCARLIGRLKVSN